MRRAVPGLVALALGGLLAGCAGAPAADGPSPTLTRVAAESSPSGPASPALPPGDPGLDAPAVPDPGAPSGDADAHGHGADHAPHGQPNGHAGADREADGAAAPSTVPAGALLDVATVSGVLGGSWSESRATPGVLTRCVAVADAVAVGATGFRTAEGFVRQLVATAASGSAADRAVSRLAARLGACGWQVQADPRLGTASAALTRGPAARATVVAAEGVVVVLVGAGRVPADAGGWGSLVDLAVGSSCPAAPEGCH